MKIRDLAIEEGRNWPIGPFVFKNVSSGKELRLVRIGNTIFKTSLYSQFDKNANNDFWSSSLLNEINNNIEDVFGSYVNKYVKLKFYNGVPYYGRIPYKREKISGFIIDRPKRGNSVCIFYQWGKCVRYVSPLTYNMYSAIIELTEEAMELIVNERKGYPSKEVVLALDKVEYDLYL